MGLYENIKDVANVLQKADNIELYSRLIDLSSQALDMQDELSKLRTENRDLKEKKRLEWEAEKERRANTFEDRTLTCKKCGKEWVWEAKEQKFFKEKGFFRPSMCKECRASIKTINNFRR